MRLFKLNISTTRKASATVSHCSIKDAMTSLSRRSCASASFSKGKLESAQSASKHSAMSGDMSIGLQPLYRCGFALLRRYLPLLVDRT